MARQGFDIQLTRYDERGWRATFYTTGMELADERDGHGVGAHALVRDTAGGVGGVEEGPQHRRMNGSNDQRARVRTQAWNRP
jgi:hypothetical protein